MRELMTERDPDVPLRLSTLEATVADSMSGRRFVLVDPETGVGRGMLAFPQLTDEELDRKGSMPAFGGEATTEQLIQFVIFESAMRHFDSMKTAVGR